MNKKLLLLTMILIGGTATVFGTEDVGPSISTALHKKIYQMSIDEPALFATLVEVYRSTDCWQKMEKFDYHSPYSYRTIQIIPGGLNTLAARGYLANKGTNGYYVSPYVRSVLEKQIGGKGEGTYCKKPPSSMDSKE